MSYRELFSNRHVILPVVHVADEAQCLRNVKIARDAGADGVFLINHDINHQDLLAIQKTVRALNPDWWIGVNCLELYPAEVFKVVDNGVSGVWVDNAGILEGTDVQPEASKNQKAQKSADWNGLYFGGVAFKYQRPVADLAGAAAVAAKYMEVVTTSGPGTGEAADIDKIRVMKEAIGDHPLAIASGLTPENVAQYLDYADCFLVATGISKTFEDFDPPLVEEFIQVVRSASS